MAAIETVSAGGVPARLYRPLGDEQSALVWFHGGGWVVGDLDYCDAIARLLAARSACAVVSVDYRMAPEHRFPCAVEDAWTATQWAARQFATVAVGGDSAGGTLAAAVALRARDHGLPLAMQLLVYPALDSDVAAPYRREFMERYATFDGIEGYAELVRDGTQRAWSVYIPDPALRRTPDASPMYAPSLAGVAPAVLVTAEHDFCTAETNLYGDRLREAGVPVNERCYVGQIHAFFHVPGASDDARDAAAYAGSALRLAFAAGRASGA